MPARMASWFVAQRDRLALEPDLAGIGPGHAEQGERQLGAAGAEQPGEAQHLAAPQGEGDVLRTRRRGVSPRTSSRGSAPPRRAR